MKVWTTTPETRNACCRRALRTAKTGSVLVIVLWIAFGLVSIALYFAHSMSFELRAADNRVAATEADQAIAGAIRYVSNVLANVTAIYPGAIPDPLTYPHEAVSVGNATFWLIGGRDNQGPADQPYFDLVDEAGKLNLNTVTAEMLEYLPRMTAPLAGAIVDWRDADSDVNSIGGAEDDMYTRLTPSYHCKNANFESVDELRLVYGMDLELLYGEDANLNGVLDLNENDADQAFPMDNRDSRLDPGWLEYFTVYSKEPTTRTNGSPRVNVTNVTEMTTLLTDKFGADRAAQIQSQLTGGGGGGGAGGGAGGGGGQGPRAVAVGSLLEYFMLSGMTASDFAQIETDITTGGTNTTGRVNVNTASEVVLACIPGIGLENAPSLTAYRQNNRTSLLLNPSLAWVAEVLSQTNAVQAGPYLTGHTYQFTADIAAVGHFGRGYRRVKAVFDTTQGTPRVIYRQDLTHLGWALGREVRTTLLTLAKNRP